MCDASAGVADLGPETTTWVSSAYWTSASVTHSLRSLASAQKRTGPRLEYWRPLADRQRRWNLGEPVRGSEAKILSVSEKIILKAMSTPSSWRFSTNFEWLMTSKHLLRSIKHKIEINLESMAERISVKLVRSLSVECRRRKPCWVGERRWLEER